MNPSPFEQTCSVFIVCPIAQLFFLDSWIGCGNSFIFVGVSWFLSCILWIWMFFPFTKDIIKKHVFKQNYIWITTLVINLLWACAFYTLWDYDIFTLSPMPILRYGEFLIGCGAALALKEESSPIWNQGLFWVPFLIVITLYILQSANRGLQSICLLEETSHQDCSLWKAGQTQITDVKPPCITIFDKILNKYSFVWAFLIHGIAKQEIELRDTNRKTYIMKFLLGGTFKFLNTFSITLYLSHVSMATVIRYTGKYLLDWNPNQWRDDTFLFSVYLISYGLHCILTRVITWISNPNPMMNAPRTDEFTA
jgi:hypothetical protein